MPRTIEELCDFAQHLKTNATKSEIKLHNELVKLNVDFRFQFIIEPFIVDFYFPKTKSIIELDSPKFHNPIKDASRDLYLTNAGYRIHRIKSYKCFKSMKEVLGEVMEFIIGNEVKKLKIKKKK